MIVMLSIGPIEIVQQRDDHRPIRRRDDLQLRLFVQPEFLPMLLQFFAAPRLNLHIDYRHVVG